MLLTVMPPPAATAVAPARLTPVMVTGTAVPRAPDVGVIAVTIAPVTVNAKGKVTLPSGVATVTFLVVSAAVAEIAQLAVTVVTLGVTAAQVMPAPMVTAVASCRPSPLIVTGTVVFRTPMVGLIDASDGPSTVNAPPAVTVPPGVVIVML